MKFTRAFPIAAAGAMLAFATLLPSTAAQAAIPGFLYGYYDTSTACRAAGEAGIHETGDWSWYFCTRVVSTGRWALYVD